ncbi:MAG: sel1 repeat family protein [Verrucomicrobia bacterium]|nr:sel1 repeat family protein [Verrucomicrobiota bacterium]
MLDKCREEGIVDFDEIVKMQDEDEECREWKRKYELADSKNPYTKSDKVLIKWLTKLAMQGQEEAQAVLGNIYYRHGEMDKAEKWYRQAAELDSVHGQYGLGRVCKDKGESAKWYTKAAEQGHLEAQLDLAQLFSYSVYNDDSMRDDALSFKWYLAAAEQGSYRGQAEVAKMYVDGIGVEPDEREALRWFIAPNDQGRWVKESDSLIQMYINGKGILEDPIEACAWFVVIENFPMDVFDRSDVKICLGRSSLRSYSYDDRNEAIYTCAEKLTEDQLELVYSRAMHICLEAAQRGPFLEKYIDLYKTD